MIRTLSFSLVALALLAPGVAAEEITVTREDCAGLVTHVPDANVAYQPGVDANGNQVASADLGGGFTYEAPTEFSFNVTINPIDYQRRRNLEANRSALAAQQSTAAATAETLETAAATLQATTESLATTEAALEAEDAAVLVTFEAASQTIVDNTGGASPTAAQLTARATQLDQLHTNTFDDPTYTDLQERIALNQQSQATNAAEIAANEASQATNNATVQSLAQEEAALDKEAAEIAGKGTSASLTVGTVRFENGRVYLNDQLIGDKEQARLEDACRAAFGG